MSDKVTSRGAVAFLARLDRLELEAQTAEIKGRLNEAQRQLALTKALTEIYKTGCFCTKEYKVGNRRRVARFMPLTTETKKAWSAYILSQEPLEA